MVQLQSWLRVTNAPSDTDHQYHELGVRLSRDRRNVVLRLPGENGPVALLVALEAARELRDALDLALRLAEAPEAPDTRQ
jgi:hypothetical protein